MKLSRRKMLYGAAGAVSGTALGSLLVLKRRTPQHVVLVVMDAFRADRLGLRRGGQSITPNLDRIAGGGRLFVNAMSACSSTKPSVASIMTGACPAYHGVMDPERTLPRNAFTLPEMLKAGGFRCHCIQTNVWLAAERAVIVIPHIGFNQGFDTYEDLSAPPAKNGISAYADAAEVVARADEVLSTASERVFLYVHFMETHQPWMGAGPREETGLYADEKIAPNTRYGEDAQLVARAGETGAEVSEAEHRRLVQIYDEAVRYLDRQIGRLAQVIDRRLGLDRTLVVITSDHGEELGERGWYGHGRTLYSEVTRVPLVMSGPGSAPGVEQRCVSNAWLYETLRRMLSPGGRKMPTAALADERPSRVIAQHRCFPPRQRKQWGKLVRDGFSLVTVKDENGRLVMSESYNLNDDPSEVSPLQASEQDIEALARVTRDYASLARKHGLSAEYTTSFWQMHMNDGREKTQDAPKVDSRLQDQLRALGYLH